MLTIALDGPAGAGKSTIAKRIAEKLDILYLDTGAMYRTVALAAFNAGIAPNDKEKVEELLDKIQIEVKYLNGKQHTYLDGEDVSESIRQNHISMGASAVSSLQRVREVLVDLQRKIASDIKLIMDGRDIGTCVLPNAKFKFFLTATPEERANRRYKELLEKGQNDLNYDDILKDIIKRDYDDSHREISPLKKADDAIEIDSTSMSIDEVVNFVIKTIGE